MKNSGTVTLVVIIVVVLLLFMIFRKPADITTTARAQSVAIGGGECCVGRWDGRFCYGQIVPCNMQSKIFGVSSNNVNNFA